jgi:hypothetical protein
VVRVMSTAAVCVEKASEMSKSSPEILPNTAQHQNMLILTP